MCPVCPTCEVCPTETGCVLPPYNSDGSNSVVYTLSTPWDNAKRNTYAQVVNNSLAKVSAKYNEGQCNFGSDCNAGPSAEQFFSDVCKDLRSQGFRCGKHEAWTDEICIGSCSEKICQGAHVYNYGGYKVKWATGAFTDTWSWE